MLKKLDKYQTLLEFLKVIAPEESFINLQMAQCDFVSSIMHKAAEGIDFDSSISPEALVFVKNYSRKIFKDLQLFLENLKDAEFIQYEENADFEIVRAEITSFISLFSDERCDDDVKRYFKTVSSVYEIL